MIKSIIAFK